MKIKYDMTDNYFKCYNESQGIMMAKDEILKNPKSKLYTYIEKGVINLLLIVLVLILSRILYYFDNSNGITKILDIICLISTCLLVLYFFIFFTGYLVEKRRKHVGNLEVDATGIKDLSDNGMIIGFSWDNIKAVVIKKHTVNIITDSSIYLFMNVRYKDRLLNAIERYNPTLPIIDKSK